MKKLLTTLSILLIATVSYAQDAALTLTIKSDKEVYEVEEEMVINAEFKNNSKKIIILNFTENSLNLDWDFNINIKRNGNPLPSQRVIDYKSVIYKKKKKEIAAGDSYNVRLILSKIKWIDESPFLKKGKYHIEISYSYQIAPDQATAITSNTITIEVVEKKEPSSKYILL